MIEGARPAESQGSSPFLVRRSLSGSNGHPAPVAQAAASQDAGERITAGNVSPARRPTAARSLPAAASPIVHLQDQDSIPAREMARIFALASAGKKPHQISSVIAREHRLMILPDRIIRFLRNNDLPIMSVRA